jgi:hypothetical protein
MCFLPSHHYCAPVGDSKYRCHMTGSLPNNAVNCQPPSFLHFCMSLLVRARKRERATKVFRAADSPDAPAGCEPACVAFTLSAPARSSVALDASRDPRVHLTRNGQMFRKVQRV